MALQADYAAQVIGLNTDHMAPNELLQHAQSAMFATHPAESSSNKRPMSREGPSPVQQPQVHTATSIFALDSIHLYTQYIETIVHNPVIFTDHNMSLPFILYFI